MVTPSSSHSERGIMIYRLVWAVLPLLFAAKAFAADPLMDRQPQATGLGTATGGASLFSGAQEGSFFAPYPKRVKKLRRKAATTTQRLSVHGSTEAIYAEWIRGLIAQAEAGKAGYDAVQLSAKIKPPQRPTELTIGEIYAWIKETPGQHHAIGRYQFIPKTLRRLVDHAGIDETARFTPALQDRLADQLLKEAGLQKLISGNMGRKSFMNRLATIWAGLPTSSGKSHYDGYAGNSATMSWRHFEREMAKYFPS